MPLPWNKGKVSRISRIVADLQPPKPRHSSLVVETGFPTSLIDLFVKNRDRLKKPIKRRKKQRQQPLVDNELVISDPIPLSSSRDLVIEPFCTVHKENLEVSTECSDGTFEVIAGGDQNLDSDKSNKVVEDDCSFKKNRDCVLMAVLKMFVVIVLALSARRLVVAITMSAFFLIFLEYIGNHYSLCFLEPCSSARIAFQSLIQRVLFFIRRRSEEEKKGSNLVEDDHNHVVDACALIEKAEEIEVVVPKLDAVSGFEENETEENETIRDLLKRDTRLGNSIEEDEDHSHSRKMRRKIIKKLVPKKFQKKRPKGKEKELVEADLVSEVSSCLADDKLCRCEDTEEQDNFEASEHMVSAFSTESDTKSEEIVVEQNVDSEKEGNSGYLMLFLIVLTGLVGGRILALLITVTSCSMLKLVRRRWKSCK